jgi:hypothetical protein
VLAELARAPDEWFREIMSAAVRYLHAFAREVNLTEAKFHHACSVIAKLGALSTASHNEVVLAAGSLGLSALLCLLNNAGRLDRDGGRRDAGRMDQAEPICLGGDGKARLGGVSRQRLKFNYWH